MKSIIPMRPEGFVSSLQQTEQTALTWYVLSGCTKKDAFFAFCRPDMMASKAKAAVDDYVKQFYARKEVKEYIEAYQKAIDGLFHPAPVKVEQTESLEERKARAKTRAMEFAMSLAENIEQAEDPEYVLKLMDKVGLLDGDEQVEIKPQRFLGVRCSECAYKKFIEENCEEVPDGTEIAGK